MKGYITLALVAVAILVISWSCAEDYVPDAPDTPEVAHKMAVANKQFGQMSEEEHKQSLGGIEGATKYFEIIAYQLAKSLGDSSVRAIFLSKTPEWTNGEVRLAKIAKDHPEVAAVFSNGLKQLVRDKRQSRELAESNELAIRTGSTSSDTEAFDLIVHAMYDMEIVLVNPTGKRWDGQVAIPVHWIPIDDDAPVLNGFDPSLNPVTIPSDITMDALTTPYLQLNFDEDPPKAPGTVQIKNNRGIFNFFVTPAYANYPDNHGRDCYHERLIQIARDIVIYDDHEPGPNLPEIQIEVYYKQNAVRSRPRYDLPNVDEIQVRYTEYDYKRGHGTCGAKLEKIQVWEDDAINDDSLACWKDVNFGARRTQTLMPNRSVCGHDALLVVSQKDNETGAPPRP